MIGRLNHVAIAVPDLARPRRSIATRWAPRFPPMPQPAHGVTMVFVELPNTKIELLEPLGAEFADRQVPGEEPRRRHASRLLRGGRHPRRPRPAQGARARACSATASPRSAPTASRCCSCTPRISAARWSSWSRHEALRHRPSPSISSSGGSCSSRCCPGACAPRAKRAQRALRAPIRRVHARRDGLIAQGGRAGHGAEAHVPAVRPVQLQLLRPVPHPPRHRHAHGGRLLAKVRHQHTAGRLRAPVRGEAAIWRGPRAARQPAR